MLIPAFAVDRTELVLLELDRLRRAGRIPAVPVYVDSPMALAALEVYRARPRRAAGCCARRRERGPAPARRRPRGARRRRVREPQRARRTPASWCRPRAWPPVAGSSTTCATSCPTRATPSCSPATRPRDARSPAARRRSPGRRCTAATCRCAPRSCRSRTSRCTPTPASSWRGWGGRRRRPTPSTSCTASRGRPPRWRDRIDRDPALERGRPAVRRAGAVGRVTSEVRAQRSEPSSGCGAVQLWATISSKARRVSARSDP